MKLIAVLCFMSLFFFSSCLYTNVKTPGWYYSQSYTDVKGMEVTGKMSGEACASSYLWAVYTGDESFDTAVSNAVGNKADMLFNVHTDYSFETYFLNIYFKRCTKVTGIGVKIPSGVKAIKNE